MPVTRNSEHPREWLERQTIHLMATTINACLIPNLKSTSGTLWPIMRGSITVGIRLFNSRWVWNKVQSVSRHIESKWSASRIPAGYQSAQWSALQARLLEPATLRPHIQEPQSSRLLPSRSDQGRLRTENQVHILTFHEARLVTRYELSWTTPALQFSMDQDKADIFLDMTCFPPSKETQSTKVFLSAKYHIRECTLL